MPSNPRAIGIYEPIYASGQTLVDPAFLPFYLPDNSRAAWRELRILIDMYAQGVSRRHKYTGLFSPKFSLKTRMSGGDFVDFVASQPDCDVCFINPFPHLAVISYNVWQQGETFHPGIMERAQLLLDAVEIPWRLDSLPRQTSDIVCFSNYWVGTANFWDSFVGGILVPIGSYLDRNPDSTVCRAVLQETQHTDPAPYLPFIAERLFTTFLAMHPELRVAHYPLDAHQYCFTDVEKRMVDFAESAAFTAMPEDAQRELLDLFQFLDREHLGLHHATVPHPHTLPHRRV